ncbi:hypothetical protein HRS9122_01139 [Pyrenophora teres f. teres]|nr:hypothetical protein HRS9122_01139 [Pyrenophora teres f. teres]
MDNIALPPSPSGQTKQAKKQAKKCQRKAVNVPLPEGDDVDLIEVSESNSSAPPGVQEPPVDDGSARQPVSPQTQLPVRLDEASADHVPADAESCTPIKVEHGASFEKKLPPVVDQRIELRHGASYVIPPLVPMVEDMAAPTNPFLHDQFTNEYYTLTERVNMFNRFEQSLADRAKPYHDTVGEKPTCDRCGRKHPPPCLSKADIAVLKSLRAEGRRLRAEFSAAGSDVPKMPKNEMLEDELPMASCPAHGFTQAEKRNIPLCRTCAKFHPGGGKECTAPFCPKGCDLNHKPGESCSSAIKRFKNLDVYRGNGEGHGDKEKSAPAPAPSDTMDTREDDAKFSSFYSALPNDPLVLQAAGVSLRKWSGRGLRKSQLPLERLTQARGRRSPRSPRLEVGTLVKTNTLGQRTLEVEVVEVVGAVGVVMPPPSNTV